MECFKTPVGNDQLMEVMYGRRDHNRDAENHFKANIILDGIELNACEIANGS